MSPRLSKIVTRTGDDGTTGLGDGTRVPKDSARIEAIGVLDELNSAVGVLLSQAMPHAVDSIAPTRDWLIDIQQRLFDLGGELAVPGLALLGDETVTTLEHRIEQLNAQLPPLREFVLPGGSPAGAACHLARAICRRAERRCWALVHASGAAKSAAPKSPAPKSAAPKSRTARIANRKGSAAAASAAVSGSALRYLNRLSDFLFVLARLYARAAGSSEPLWQHERRRRRNSSKA
jgi:cob(I)alamin adenosyltransferase